MLNAIPAHAQAPLFRRASLPGLVVAATAGVFLAGAAALVACVASGHFGWVSAFFRFPGALLLVGLNVAALGLALRARAQFAGGEPMRLAWSVFALAAGCRLAGGLLLEMPGQAVFLESGAGGQALGAAPALYFLALAVGGPLHVALLGAALATALGAYKRLGMFPRLRVGDWVLLGLACALCGWVLRSMHAAAHAPGPVTLVDAMNWANDPLLGVVLAEAVLIRRSVLNMGSGLIARCWGAFAGAVLFTGLSYVALWMNGNPVVGLSATAWYLASIAALAFALAPAYQLEAIRRAGAAE
jgi:hypothetical protein